MHTLDCGWGLLGGSNGWWHLQRLATKDIDNWEQKRVERLRGEHDGKL